MRHSPGSVCRRFPTPGSLLVPLQVQVAAGWMTQVRSAGQTSPCSYPSRMTTLISCPVITIPPPSEGGLARARGTGKNVVILACVLLPKMFLELGLELSPWPLHCLMMSWRLLEPNCEQGHVVRKLWDVSPEPSTSWVSVLLPQETQKTWQIGETWQER